MKFIPIIALLLLVSCSNKDEQFCKCLTEGEALNEYTQQFFEKSASAEEQEKVKQLKDAKAEACKDYQVMSGDIMRQKKAECEN